MVVVNTGVVNEFPEPKELPPVDAANQFSVPAPEVAPSVTVPLPHLEAGVVETILGVVFTVAVTAVLAEVQLLEVAAT